MLGLDLPDYLVKLMHDFNDDLITTHEQYDRCATASDDAMRARDYDAARRWNRRAKKVEERMRRLRDRQAWIDRLAQAHHDETCPNCNGRMKDVFELPMVAKPVEKFVN